MKNMTLPVRNSKFSILSGRVVVGLLLLIALTGCKAADPFVDPGDTPDPHWVITVENDMTSSMTVIVKVSFAEQAGTLAAFIGNDCCGVATSENYIDGLYYLYISPSAQREDVQLKFYSPNLKRIFEAKETFPFVNDDRLGSSSAPYTPEWTVAK